MTISGRHNTGDQRLIFRAIPDSHMLTFETIMLTERRNATWWVIRKRPDLRCALQPNNVELSITLRLNSLIEPLEMTFRMLNTLMSWFTLMLMVTCNMLRSEFDISYILSSCLKGNREQQVISERVFQFQ